MAGDDVGIHGVVQVVQAKGDVLEVYEESGRTDTQIHQVFEAVELDRLFAEQLGGRARQPPDTHVLPLLRQRKGERGQIGVLGNEDVDGRRRLGMSEGRDLLFQARADARKAIGDHQHLVALAAERLKGPRIGARRVAANESRYSSSQDLGRSPQSVRQLGRRYRQTRRSQRVINRVKVNE